MLLFVDFILLFRTVKIKTYISGYRCIFVRDCKDTDLWVVAESLDSIFDVFGEDHIDPVVEEIELVQKLKMIIPNLKSKVT